MGVAATNIDLALYLEHFGSSAVLLIAVSLFALSLSSYVKIVTVLAIIRAGIGFHSLPSAFVTGILALALSFFVMFPTLQSSLQAYDTTVTKQGGASSVTGRTAAFRAGLEEWKSFLSRHAHKKEQKRFAKIARELDRRSNQKTEQKTAPEVSESTWRVLAPSFVVSELKEAFATGLSVFLPFLIIDLVVANLLVAVGIGQLSPLLVSLPFKLLLFVMVDGWSLLTSNLVLSYVR